MVQRIELLKCGITVTFVCKDKVFQQNDELKSMQYEAAKRLSIALILMSRFAEKPILLRRKVL